ncbi:MAG: hypothetical protein WD669_02710 [Pirellulales bacterium]
MNRVVIDTNVAVVANRRAAQAGPKCVLACIDALSNTIEQSVVILDRSGTILSEYLRNLSFAGQPGAGDAFFKWLWQNQSNPKHCELVDIHEQSQSADDFLEFPHDSRLSGFDRSDRKFVAVSIACHHRPPICNAVDSDWWLYREILASHGVQVDFLCPDQFASLGAKIAADPIHKTH